MEGQEPTKTTNVAEVEAETDEQDLENDTASETETFEESFKIAAAELRQGQQDGNKDQAEPPEEAPAEPAKSADDQVKDAPTKTKKAKEDGEADLDLDPELLPPARMTEQEKELYHKLPTKWAKKFLSRTVRQLEASQTRSNTQYANKVRDAEAILQAVRPYRDDWAAVGVSETQGIVELAGLWGRLKDPKTRAQAYRQLQGTFPADADDDDNGSPQQGKTDPTVEALKAEIRALKEIVEPEYNARRQTKEAQLRKFEDEVGQQLESVQLEMDEAGEYKYPKLHLASFLEQWKPRVSALVGTAFGQTYRDAGINAYRMLEGLPPIASGKSNQTSLPQNGNHAKRAVEAAGSLRGRTSLASPVSSAEIEYASPDESFEESWRRANKRGR